MVSKGETEEKQRTTLKLQQMRVEESLGRIRFLTEENCGVERKRGREEKVVRVVRVRGEEEEEEEEKRKEGEGLRGERKMDFR